MAAIGGITFDSLTLAGDGVSALGEMLEAVTRPGVDRKAYLKTGKRPGPSVYVSRHGYSTAGKNTKKSGDEASKSVMGIGDAAKQGAVELAKMATAGLTIQQAMAVAKSEIAVSLAEIEKSVDRLLEKENLLRSGARGGLTAGGTPIPAALRQGIKDATASGGIGEKQMTELMVAMQGANTSLKGDVLKFAPALKKAEGMVDLPSFAVGMAQLQQVLPELAPEDLADATMQIGGNVGGFDKMVS